MSHNFKYLNHYPEKVKSQVSLLIKNNKLDRYLLDKYPNSHNTKSDKLLFEYANDLKNRHLKNSPTLSKVLYDSKLDVIHNALGTHHFISRVQGSKLKSKNEIRVSSLFKKVPQEFLDMILTHEIAHFKEKEHNKAFYKLCEYMQPTYHQVEFDLRLYLTYIDLHSKLKEWN